MRHDDIEDLRFNSKHCDKLFYYIVTLCESVFEEYEFKRQ